MLLANANKWKCEAIDKEEKLAKAILELNENLRHFEVLMEAHRKLKVKVEGYKFELNVSKDMFSLKQKKIRSEFDSMTK